MSDTPLKKLLLDMLKRSGAITFERYMGLCLYHPEYGYYAQARDRTALAAIISPAPTSTPFLPV